MPCGVQLSRGVREREYLRILSEVLVQPGEVPHAPLEECGEFAQLDPAEGRRDLGGLEVPADFVEDEQVVVLESVELREEAPVLLLRAKELALASPSPASQHETAVDELLVVEQHHPARPRSGNDVGEREARHADLGASPRGGAAQCGAQAVTGVLYESEVVALADVADAVPIRTVADQIRLVLPEMTDKQLEEAIKGMRQEVTAESTKKMKEMLVFS